MPPMKADAIYAVNGSMKMIEALIMSLHDHMVEQMTYPTANPRIKCAIAHAVTDQLKNGAVRTLTS